MWMIERLRDGYLQARESGPLNEGATLVQKFATAEEAIAARDEMFDPGGHRRAAFEARVATESAAATQLHRFRSECRERGRLPDDELVDFEHITEAQAAEKLRELLALPGVHE